MPWTIETALEDKYLSQTRKLLSQYEFQLGTLTPRITIRLYETVGGKGVWWEQSHYIKTPGMGDKYCPSRPWGDDEAYALHLAVTSLTSYYGNALKQGASPSDDWLIPNKHF